MSLEKALSEIRLDELSKRQPFWAKIGNSKYHVFYASQTSCRCQCGKYTVRPVEDNDQVLGFFPPGRKMGIKDKLEVVKPSDDQVDKRCRLRHERIIAEAVEMQREKLRVELRKTGDDIVEIVRDQVWMYALTLDTEEIQHIVDALGNVVDAQKMRTLQRLRPEEVKALFKSMEVVA